MSISRLVQRVVAVLALSLAAVAALAQSYPAPKPGEWIAKDFRFHTG